MGGAKEYQDDFEKMMGQLEAKDDLLRKKSAQEFMKRLEDDRKAAGMTPKEMFRIFETRGMTELLSEVQRRLKK